MKEPSVNIPQKSLFFEIFFRLFFDVIRNVPEIVQGWTETKEDKDTKLLITLIHFNRRLVCEESVIFGLSCDAGAHYFHQARS